MSEETTSTEQTQSEASETQAAAGQDEQTQEQEPLTFDSWIDAQDEPIQMMIEQHTNGLKNALSDERTERKKLQTQLKKLSAQAEQGSELQQQLDQMNATLEAQTLKATFYESAPADVANLKLAHMAAQDGGYIAKNGSVDWDSIRSEYPELFAKKASTPASNAGSGTQQRTNHRPPSMNDFMRAAAGIS